MKKEKQKPKRNHHTLTKLYLKGFVERKGEPFIWEYVKGKSYQLGSTRYKDNPSRISIRVASVIRDFYAFDTDSGKKDFDSYENKLEKLEKPNDLIFEKIRSHQTITLEEKEAFASYIALMLKRVPLRMKKMGDIFPSFLENHIKTSTFIQSIKSKDAEIGLTDKQLEKLKEARQQLDARLESYKIKTPKHILLESMIKPSGLTPFFFEMTWQFLVAKDGNSFITGDHPVFFFESFGINKPFSEVTFPISSDVALAMSWHNELREGFFNATTEAVLEINRRTASCALNFVYHSQKRSWVGQILNKKQHRFNLLYPYSE